MTLAEVLERVKRMPEVGDREYVVDRKGVAHVVVVTHVRHNERTRYHSALSAVLSGDVDFMCLCEGLTYETREIQRLEIAPFPTCMECATR